ncbi:MAG: family 20 glycosylhydrolase [Kiritimatiellae bacterium]|nr:family 20 glycosylhydrolase [Kiritimatiellia bacterium]
MGLHVGRSGAFLSLSRLDLPRADAFDCRVSQLSFPVLLPMPRSIHIEQGAHSLRRRRITIYDDSGLGTDIAARIQQDVRREVHAEATIAGPSDKPHTAEILLRHDPELRPQAYALHITPRQAVLSSADAAGLWHAAMTFRQLLRQYRDAIPSCRIEDAPDFLTRGVMLDISRDKVPSMETLFRFVDELAEWKINRLELYTEHTFAYRNHREVWANASPMTAEDVRELDHFCAERFIELVPNQNCFGHLHRWLALERYKPLAEAPDGFMTPWGERRSGSFSLNPLDPRNMDLVEELLAELLPNFRSRKVNVGCDETFDLGQGRSREACEREGKGRVYLDFLLKIHRAVSAHGHTMHFWGDIILNHPELIPALPRDVVPLVWGYEANHPFAEQCAKFANAGFSFFVCPGTSTWNSVVGRTDNALENLNSAARHGLAHGASGYLITAWGDNGHWQPYAVDLLPLAAGAARAWALEANREADLAAQLDVQVFKSEARMLGALAYDLGLVYRELGYPIENASALFRLLFQRDIGNLRAAISDGKLQSARRRLQSVPSVLAGARCGRDDAGLITNEFALAGRLLDLGIARGLGEDAAQRAKCWAEFIPAFREQWLARNRPGGLEDSVAVMLKRMRDER